MVFLPESDAGSSLGADSQSLECDQGEIFQENDMEGGPLEIPMHDSALISENNLDP